jgi:hypothetical protein
VEINEAAGFVAHVTPVLVVQTAKNIIANWKSIKLNPGRADAPLKFPEERCSYYNPSLISDLTIK